MSNKQPGVIVAYNDNRGFGWIRPSLEKEPGVRQADLFFHVTDTLCFPRVSLRVRYSMGANTKGPCAVCVEAEPQNFDALDLLAGKKVSDGGAV